MAVSPFQIGLAIELLAAALGGLQGALFAANHRFPRIDVLGVIVIGLTVALGGSLLRDIVLNQPPVVIWVNWYLLVAGASALLGMGLQPLLARGDRAITVLDAIVMGMFGAIAASKALSLGTGSVGALVVGVIGAIGGGLLRDVILNRPVSILHIGTLYAVAAGAGSGALIVLVKLGVGIPVAGIIATVVTTLVRLGAVAFNWSFPEQRPIRFRTGDHDRRRLARTTLVLLAAVAVAITGATGESAWLAPAITGRPSQIANADQLLWGGAVVGLAVALSTSGWLLRRRPDRHRFVQWIAGISAAGVMAFGAVGLLSAGFWTTARNIDGFEAFWVGLRFLAVWVGPAFIGLVASIVLLAVARRQTRSITNGHSASP